MQRYEDLIERLEKDFTTDSLQYKGYCIWPLFRILLFYHHPKEDRQRKEILLKKSFKAKIGDVISSLQNLSAEYSNYKNHKKQLSNLLTLDEASEDEIRKADVVFFHYQLHRNQNINGVFSNIFLHPLEAVIESKFSCLSLEDIEYPEQAKYPRHKSSVVISSQLKKAEVFNAFRKLLNNIRLLLPFQKPHRVQGFNELKKQLPAELQSSFYSSDDFLIYQMEKIIAYQKKLVRIFKQVKPKVVVQTSFYHSLGIAVNLACSELGIKSVEMQHGVLEPLAFWNFNQKKAMQFKMLPSYFWLWEADSCKTINQWIENQNRIVLGGNIWMKKMLKEMSNGSEATIDFENQIATYAYRILFSMQFTPFNTIPDFLIEEMKENSDFLWLFRVHPRSAQQDLPAIKKTLTDRGIFNFEVDLASSLPLPYLVQKVDLHITKFSAVVFDSAAVNIPTIFIDEYAAKIYARDYPILWNSKMVKMATDKLSLKESIQYFKSETVDFNADGYFGDDNYLGNFEKIIND